MKLITFLFLVAIYVAGVKSAAINPEGYNYEKPVPVFEQQVSEEEHSPAEGIVERAEPLESDLNELAVENAIDVEATNQEVAAEDIDLRYQSQAQETASVNEESQGAVEDEASNVDESAIDAQYAVQEEAVESNVNEAAAEIAIVEESDSQHVAVDESQENSQNIEASEAIVSAEYENQQQVANEEEVQEVVEQVAAEELQAEGVVHAAEEEQQAANVETYENESTVGQVEIQQTAEEGSQDASEVYAVEAQQQATNEEINVNESTVEETDVQQIAEDVSQQEDEVHAAEAEQQATNVEAYENESTVEQAEVQQIAEQSSQDDGDAIAGVADEDAVVAAEAAAEDGQIDVAVENRISEENSSAQDHTLEGYNYDRPLPGQLELEAGFVHQDLGSEHKSHRHGAVKRLKLKGLQQTLKAAASCGENARDWYQVVVDRSQVRPKNRRLIPYTEEIVDQSYFIQ